MLKLKMTGPVCRELPGYPAADMSEVFPMNWRFLPTVDPQVDIMLSRDLDSRPR